MCETALVYAQQGTRMRNFSQGLLFPIFKNVHRKYSKHIQTDIESVTVNFRGHTIFRENNVYCAKDFMPNSLLFIGVCMPLVFSLQIMTLCKDIENANKAAIILT